MIIDKKDANGKVTKIDTNLDWGFKTDKDYVNYLLQQNEDLKSTTVLLRGLIDILAKEMYRRSDEPLTVDLGYDEKTVDEKDELRRIARLLVSNKIKVKYAEK